MTFVLLHRLSEPNRPLYMHKNVRPDTRRGLSRGALRYMVTEDVSQARTWRTPEGAQKYAARPTFGVGKFSVVEVSDVQG